MDLQHYEERDIMQIVDEAGYPLETHNGIQTEDGYLLTLHRIPLGKNANTMPTLGTSRRHPVLLVHGMLGCSGHFLLQGTFSLPFLLADAGYDVWLANNRGVQYSRGHMRFDCDKDNEYWNFSFHEMGIYDVPALIDYILSVTSVPQLHYIGFSQGCIILFITCSERPEYAGKVSLFVALSPLLYVEGATHPWLPTFSRFERMWQMVVWCLGLKSIRLDVLRRYQHLVTSYALCKMVVKGLVALTFGTRPKKLRSEYISDLLVLAQGINYHCLFHAMQIFNSKRFLQYDCGPKRNVNSYGSERVKDYRVEHMTCPVFLYYSEQDWFLPGKNAVILAEKLSNVVSVNKVQSSDFSHFDFLVAEEAVEKIYKPIIENMCPTQTDGSKSPSCPAIYPSR